MKYNLLGFYMNDLLPKGNRLYILVEGEFKDDDCAEYYFDEHTCPTNYLGVSAIGLIEDGAIDTDPHGVFRFIKQVDADDSVNPDDLLAEILEGLE